MKAELPGRESKAEMKAEASEENQERLCKGVGLPQSSPGR